MHKNGSDDQFDPFPVLVSVIVIVAALAVVAALRWLGVDISWWWAALPTGLGVLAAGYIVALSALP
jgi:hypothetical protein